GMSMKLRGKFLVPTLLIVAICMASLGYANYRNSKDIIFNQLYSEAEGELDTMSSIASGSYIDIQKNINQFKVGNSGYAYIVEYDGKIIAHPDQKEIGLNLNDYDWGKYILGQEEGTK
ncbi:Cache 3/Cache 2 fusion domain-containing protein, partial [Methanosarcina mazei]|uniref:Cache 3/Cache 2 fusion domain-containing protein n=1 Tax=Methanosarcina mazei TaxID=2209 RepID=UPI0012D40493